MLALLVDLSDVNSFYSTHLNNTFFSSPSCNSSSTMKYNFKTTTVFQYIPKDLVLFVLHHVHLEYPINDVVLLFCYCWEKVKDKGKGNTVSKHLQYRKGCVPTWVSDRTKQTSCRQCFEVTLGTIILETDYFQYCTLCYRQKQPMFQGKLV